MTIEIGINPARRRIFYRRAVMAERNRRIVNNFSFGGNLFEFTTDEAASIIAIGNQGGIDGSSGNLRWFDPNEDFAWPDINDVPIPMDAATAFNFAKAATKHRWDHVRSARALIENPVPFPQIGNNANWP